ncbi:MATE family efflux transporter [Clostridium sp. 1001271B_151109_B4]|uniref:MATE family efflux transporter n=1 Tax=Clostridium sp. 1001271B_151109_B4 TaxID=2787148 RepID=UPI0018A8E944|nr:MATE family efflux transporter [Clostridium sp. 1001271B_151109_B4]
MEKEVSMNKMGIIPIKKLMITMGMPMILSMILQALYNIVDSYFVSNIPGMGDYAVNALTLAFPIQMLMIAIGVGTGVGVNSLLSKSIGEGNREKASHISGNAIFIGICIYLVFLVFGLFGVNSYITSQTTNSIITEMGNSYLSICTIFSFGVVQFTIYEKLLQATGRTTLSTIAQITGAVSNMILDPILIFGMFGLPAMGVNGAAYATIIGQILSCIMDMIFHYKFNKDIDSKLKYMKPQKHIIVEMYKVGIPAIVMQALMSVMTYGVNIIFGALSISLVTAYGVYYKIQQFVFFAAFGMNNAIIPIIGFNYGKRDEKRVNEAIKYGMIYTLIIMAIGMVILQLFAKQLIGIFALSEQTQILCIKAIRIVTLGYLFVGANVAYQGIFQALGCGVRSLIVSLIRLIVVTLPLAWVLTKLQNAQNIVWISFPIAEACAFIIAIIFMKQIRKKKIDNLNEVDKTELINDRSMI